jgi:hypothetical protein
MTSAILDGSGPTHPTGPAGPRPPEPPRPRGVTQPDPPLPKPPPPGPPTPRAIEHGTVSAYAGKTACRCERCREAMRNYQRQRVATNRARPVPPEAWHGTASTYVNYGCRCDSCRAAWAGYFRKRRAAGREKAGAP